MFRNARIFLLRDERGALTPFIIVLFLGLILLTGVALDLMRHESERSDLQAALDRGVLAAASLTQTEDAETVVRGFIRNRRSLSAETDTAGGGGTDDGDDDEIGGGDDEGSSIDSLAVGTYDEPELTVVPTTTVNGRRVAATARYDMDTVFLGLVGLSTLEVKAQSTAQQGISNVEISLVLDISGTMRWAENNKESDDNRLTKLRPAARQFISTVLDGNASQATTISIVPYAGQVNPGEFMFDYIGGVRTYGFEDSSCPEFATADNDASGIADDFDTADLPSAGSYEQVPNFHYWRINTAWMDWGWCPTNDTAITYLSNDEAALHDVIDSIRLHDGTGTYNGMKWGLALLNPTAQPAISALVDEGIVEADFRNRPLPWADPETLKVIVLMTDGQITEQRRPTNPNDPSLATKEVDIAPKTPAKVTFTRANGLTAFYHLCDIAKANGVTVFTIAFEAPPGARAEMRNCASTPSHFYDVVGLQIESAFEQIAATIGKLKLVE